MKQLQRTLYPAALLLGLFSFSQEVHAACTVRVPIVDYQLGGSSFIINKYIGEGNQKEYAKDAQAVPNRHSQVLHNCNSTFQNSFFQLTADSGLDFNDTKLISTPSGMRKFLAIKSTQNRSDMPLIYMSYSIYDPGYPNQPSVITEPNHEYKVIQNNVNVSTLGLVLDKIYLYIVVNSTTPAQSYTVPSFKIGEFYAKQFANATSSTVINTSDRIIVNISGLNFQIKQSTCTLDRNNYLLQLDTAAVKDFSATNEMVRPKNFNVKFTCPDEPDGTNFVARIMDTHPLAIANDDGILLNQKESGQGGANVDVQLLTTNEAPIKVGSSTQDKVFPFGTLLNHQIIFPIQAGYIAHTFPVTAGLVNAIATISVDYN